MRIGISVDYANGFHEAADRIVELERSGIEVAVVPIYIRTPSLLAKTAAGLDFVSDGRFRLGIGTSGPQVIEGFHGVPFDAPLGRTREVVEICRKVWRRERLNYHGKHYQIPLPPDRGTGSARAAMSPSAWPPLPNPE